MKGNFVQRNKKERDRKEKELHLFLVEFAGNLSVRVSGKQSSLNLSIFLFFLSFFFFFFFFFLVLSKFQSSLNFESSLRFFSAEFSVEFSFSWNFFQSKFLGRTSVVDLHLLLFLGKLHSRSEWRNQSAG